MVAVRGSLDAVLARRRRLRDSAIGKVPAPYWPSSGAPTGKVSA